MAKSLHLLSYLLFFALIALRVQVSNAYASRDGFVPILKDEHGFYVEVDFQKNPTSAADTGKFMLSLVQSQTFFADNNCLGFENFGCAQHNCKVDPYAESKPYSDMFFAASMKKNVIEAYLDHQEWELQVNGNILDAGSCKSKVSDSIGAGRQGIIGLSPIENSYKNYIYNWNKNLLFSLSINKNLTGGLLAFSKNQSIIDSSGSAKTLLFRNDNDKPWRTPEGDVKIKFPGGKEFASASLMFDIHADVMAFPIMNYRYIINTLADHGISCPNSLYKPECKCTKEISSLPTIIIEIQGQELAIPPSAYLADPVTPVQSTVTLNFKAVDTRDAGVNYIYPDYERTIILNSHFLSQYYTLFMHDRMEFYGPPTSAWKNPWLWIIVVIVVIAVGVGAGIYIKKRKDKSLEKDSSFLQNSAQA